MKRPRTPPVDESIPAPRKYLTFGEFRFDPVNGVLQRAGSDLVMPPRALGVLKCLLERPGDIVSKDDLVDATWEDVAVGDQSLSEAVGILRRALDDDPQHPTFVQTVHRRGYRFIAPVSIETEGGLRPVEALETAPPRWSRWLGLASLVPFLALALAWYINSIAPTGGQAPIIKLVARGSEPYACSLSPDGTRLTFIDEEGIIVKDLRVSQERIITSTSETYVDWPPAWSPDGRRLAYGFFVGGDNDEWQVRVIESEGGEPRVIYRSSKEFIIPCDWSPDGRDLLLLADPQESNLPERLLETSLSDGVTRELITLSASWPWRAAYSPDGRGIAYGAEIEGTSAIFTMNRDGSNPVRISHDWAKDDCLVWSPDGRYILFRTKQQSSWDFWVAEMDGLLPTGGTYLVKADLDAETYPWSWSNDGWLLYLERATDTTIYKLPVDPEGRRPAGECARFSEEFKQTVGSGVPSRRGDRVCVNVSGEDGRKFYIVSPAESRPLLVPADIRARSVIGWGHDDSWILLTERKEGEDSIVRIYIEDNVAERIAVASGPQLISNFPALSPDGNWLAMEQGPWGCERELVLVNLTDGRRRPLHVGGCRLMSAWSSDGAELVVARNLEEGKKSDIVIVSMEGGSLRQVAAWGEDAGNVGPLAWSPDGRHLAYVLHSPEKGKPNKLMSVPVSGGTPHILFEPQSGKPMPNPWRPYWSPDGSQIIFTGISWEHKTWMMRDFLRAH